MTRRPTPPGEPRVHGGPERIAVGIAEHAVATNGETLTTSGLGSCVAIALYDPASDARGLLHAMLPDRDARAPPTASAAKYVDSGLESLLDRIRDAGGDPAGLEARVVGGSEMIDLGDDPVGPRNVEAAEAELETRSIPIVGTDVGGDVGRTVRFDPDGSLRVRAADGFERTI